MCYNGRGPFAKIEMKCLKMENTIIVAHQEVQALEVKTK